MESLMWIVEIGYLRLMLQQTEQNTVMNDCSLLLLPVRMMVHNLVSGKQRHLTRKLRFHQRVGESSAKSIDCDLKKLRCFSPDISMDCVSKP